MEVLVSLENPEYVKKFQMMCGVLVKTETQPGSKHTVGGVAHNKPSYERHNSNGQPANQRFKHQYENNSDSTGELNSTVFPDCTDTHWKTDGPPSGVGEGGNFHADYEIKYKLVYYLAHVGAFLGDEVFYFLFYAHFVWSVDCVIARHTIMVWCTVMYLGQRTKDYLQWPRPPAPPVARLEVCHLYESAMPSTHAMAGTAMPLVLAVGICTRYQVCVEKKDK